MPQINRIRVNNIKYNFGTQVYDDFVMRFSCKNTIYDLANGGGKSLLMLLLLQNLIPNCTLDDKQPIEKLFRKNSGNTVIHSLIEWKLDECYVKDGMGFMTTGFCARRAGGEESDAAGVEYFNYVIFYRQFGDNDIRNLPLEQDGQRITYNGLKAYLRELEKKDFGVRVSIFEGKGEYQNFIGQYGLYESEWEIIRGINKTEGHVRAYFESNYRTSRKVVEDLLIEEIIQKSFHNRLGAKDDEAAMAKTLMEIKEQLVELARKRSDIANYDYQAKAFEGVLEKLKAFESVYREKEQLEKELAAMYGACKKAGRLQEEKAKALEGQMEELKIRLHEEARLTAVALVMEEEAALKKIEETVQESYEKCQRLKAEREAKERALTCLEAANDYEDYLEARAKAGQAREILENRLRDHEEVLDELKAIALVICRRDKAEKERLAQEVQDLCGEEKRFAQEASELEEVLGKIRMARAALVQKKEMLTQGLEEKEGQMGKKLSESTVLIAEEAPRVLEAVREEKERLSQALAQTREDLQQYTGQQERERLKLARLEAAAECCESEAARMEKEQSRQEEGRKRFQTLEKVYGETDKNRLTEKILAAYEQARQEALRQQEALDALCRQEEACRRGSYIFDGEQYARVKAYLVQTYKEDVVEGTAWFMGLDKGQKRDIRKRLPFVEYGFVIKNDFERIRQDARLVEFQGSSYLVPIVSENVIYDTRLEINSEHVVFATQELDFLYDDGLCRMRLKALEEETAGCRAACERAKERRDIIWADYLYCASWQEAFRRLGEQEEEQRTALETEIRRMQEEKRLAVENLSRIAGLCEEAASRKQAQTQELAALEERIVGLCSIGELHKEAGRFYAQLGEAKEKEASLAEEEREMRQRLEQICSELEQSRQKLAAKRERLERAQERWADFYGYYPKPEEEKTYEEKSGELLSNMPPEVLENRFRGLKEIYEKEALDAGDKQALAESFERAMQKAQAAIAYKGMTLTEVKARYDSQEVVPCSPERLLEEKEKLRLAQRDLETALLEYDSRCAMKNRIEGGADHARRQVEERFGAYTPFPCDSPKVFAGQHKAEQEALRRKINELEGQAKQLGEEQKKLAVAQKDLERIVQNAGVDITSWEAGEEAVSYDGYEAAAGAFNGLLKTEIRRKEEFQKEKLQLSEKLVQCNAHELAAEVRRSLEPPSDLGQVQKTEESIREIIEFIGLEKNRIEGSIVSMERIKANFENRCVQICANIRAELERLPKMSAITMEEQRLSMIGLHIPYVREEQVKERMSAYIDETVTGAESFKNAEERLKFIRGRLAWKKLFSVVVSDMNSIRIELYKRERLKDQSRYLPYEEAVGSTGQSQGIYIQFLIAIIHYISSINAAEGQAGVLGKTIFIDNPFGAAKDIYIWEPIFKLLKTNHVQLIVPARGATPAITGRFDVNYILGQKLTGGRQQTVVVDYHSRIQGELAEYIKMDYNQATLEF